MENDGIPFLKTSWKFKLSDWQMPEESLLAAIILDRSLQTLVYIFLGSGVYKIAAIDLLVNANDVHGVWEDNPFIIA